MATSPLMRAASAPGDPESAGDISGRDNMRQLIALRWLAVIGQCVTILTVHFAMDVALPLAAMLSIILALVALNIVSTLWVMRGFDPGARQLFVALLLDVAALTGLLYLSGGATNPFVSLFLLEVVLGAVLLDVWSSWVIVAITTGCFALLVVAHRPLALPPRFAIGMFDLYIIGTLTSFALIAVLLVAFVTRINANVRARDARLAAMRQQAAEEDHIVRMGLLASGAAHELGTPLASLSVIVNDWSHAADLTATPDRAEEIEDMRVAVERCKAIVGGILMSAGEARGEKPSITTIGDFLRDVVTEWRDRMGAAALRFDNLFADDPTIVSDIALKQVIWNVLDNAAEASRQPIDFTASRDGDRIVLQVRDTGPGFADQILRNFGKPYQSTKDRRGAGLGLFLVVNAMRKLAGRAEAENDPSGGAIVTLTFPLAALEWAGETPP